MIDKVTIAVSSMPAMVEFYEALLDSKFDAVEMFENTLYRTDCEGVEFLFCPKELAGVEAAINTVQLRLIVEDVQAAFERAMAAGGRSISEPAVIEDRQLAGLRDPDNNSIELIDRG